jgi:tetratricopeptide (TPR) repeat protein
MKIAIYAIAKNEQRFLKRCLDSCVDADYFILADTGSTDLTDWEARKYSKEIGLDILTYSISVQPFRFDDARNVALALIPSNVDICISLDMDEIMMPGWRQEVERLWKIGTTTRMRYMFDWGFGLQFKSDKIHSRYGYRWVKPCHECLVPTRIEQNWVDSDLLLIKHLPDNSKPRSNYFPLLEVSYEENPKDPRALLYFGRELFFYKKYDRAEKVLKEYLDVSTWKEEKAYAMFLLGDMMIAQGQVDRAMRYYEEALLFWPQYRCAMLRLAQHYHNIGDWSNCLRYAENAINNSNRLYHYFEEPKSWSSYPYDLAALAWYHKGNKEMAVQRGREAVNIEPSVPRLINNLKFYESL